MKDSVQWMQEFLKTQGYDIEVAPNELAVVKHSDDPWNLVHCFIARADGVYNCVEVQMGGYDEKKRVTCRDFETACFLLLAMYVSRERKAVRASEDFERIKTFVAYVAEGSADYWQGQFIIDEMRALLR